MFRNKGWICLCQEEITMDILWSIRHHQHSRVYWSLPLSVGDNTINVVPLHLKVNMIGLWWIYLNKDELAVTLTGYWGIVGDIERMVAVIPIMYWKVLLWIGDGDGVSENVDWSKKGSVLPLNKSDALQIITNFTLNILHQI